MEALLANPHPSLSLLNLSPHNKLTTTCLSSLFPTPRPHRPLSFSLSATSSSTLPTQFQDYDEDESYGEVSKIIASRTSPNKTMEYLIQWKDDHPPTWLPANLIAADVLAEYDSPWWTAAKKADHSALLNLITTDSSRDINSVDENGRTALTFVAGLGCQTCVKLLAEAGADLNHQDTSGGFTPLHMAAGYVKPNCLNALIDLGADVEVRDDKGRTALDLAREVLKATPAGNPMNYARRVGLESVIKALEGAVYEYAEVEEIMEKRGKGDRVEYLVKWKDGGDNEWVKVEWIGEDLVKDFEEGLEYGVVERIVEWREGAGGGREFLVKWMDIDDATWEPEHNLDSELIQQFFEVNATEEGNQT